MESPHVACYGFWGVADEVTRLTSRLQCVGAGGRGEGRMESIHEPRRNRLIIRGGVFRNFEPNSPEKPPRFAVKLTVFSKASVSPDVVCYGLGGWQTR